MARYSNRIDWLSFVLAPMTDPDRAGDELISERILNSLWQNFGSTLYNDLGLALEALDYGRAPYRFGWKDTTAGITIWGSDELPHFTIEISGKGCSRLHDLGLMESVLMNGAEFCSRIDLAIDLETPMTPSQVVLLREGGRSRTHSHIESDKGETLYLGSMHSEHYLRVYRYAEPHPRSHLTRMEFVARRKRAKVVAGQVLLHGIVATSDALLREAGFELLCGAFEEANPVDLSSMRPERNSGGTTRWLITQCAPAFKKLCSEGIITDPQAFLDRYFLGDDFEPNPSVD